jgi:hypothetical protein
MALSKVAPCGPYLAGADSAGACFVMNIGAGVGVPTWTALPALPSGVAVDIGTVGDSLVACNTAGTTFQLVDISGGRNVGYSWRQLAVSPT